MFDDQATTRRTSAVISRLRAELGATQGKVAEAARLDQSRVSRVEKGEVTTPDEIERVLGALATLGSEDARTYRQFAEREWRHVEPPSFWNPQREILETAEKTLQDIDSFLGDESRPWPLKRQIERQRETLLRGAAHLNMLSHNIAFIGDTAVGKSTAVAFLFDLLVPPQLATKPMDRPILETGAGGTTICEVHIRRGPAFGLTIQPLPDSELRDLVADFCSAKWISLKSEDRELREAAAVSREIDRAIRNMTGLMRRPRRTAGKTVYHDPVPELINACANDDEFRTRVLELMKLGERTRRDIWHDATTMQHPMEWIAKVFKEVNNGRVSDMTLPKSIDILIPHFGKDFGELDITIIDTKGVEAVAVREDLDLRLKDARTTIVLCSKFPDAPNVTSKILLQHMRQTFAESVNSGKVSILALPRSEEARAVKDDTGETALTDEEGYTFRQLQIEAALQADNLEGVPVTFFNAQSDAANDIRAILLGQLTRIRQSAADRLIELCSAAYDLIENHEAQAMILAVEEVAKEIKTFLDAHGKLGDRERLAHMEVLNTVRNVPYASILWASTRRNGEYTGLNIVHQIGVGAARDARARSARWFASLEDTLKTMEHDKDLVIATKTIEQIGRNAAASRAAFLDAVQRAGVEVYHKPLTNAVVWTECADIWGSGRGFKAPVAAKLEEWFEGKPKLKDRLEDMVIALWESTVLAPLRRLAEEAAPEPSTLEPEENIVPFLKRRELQA